MSQHPTAHSLFPIGLSACWQAPADVRDSFQPTAQLYDWLLDPTSLTKRLKQHCQTFHVELLGQKIAFCSAAEANDDIPEGEEVLIREVLLYCDGQPHVFARSLLPLTSLTGDEKKLATLGDHSLGQVLFSDPNLVRKGIELSCFEHASHSAKSANNASAQLPLLVNTLNLHENLPENFVMLGRRSVFLLNHKPLMVAEVFLPHALAYQAAS